MEFLIKIFPGIIFTTGLLGISFLVTQSKAMGLSTIQKILLFIGIILLFLGAYYC